MTIGKCECINELDKYRIILSIKEKIESNKKKMSKIVSPTTYLETKEYEDLKDRIEKIPICWIKYESQFIYDERISKYMIYDNYDRKE